MYRERNNFFELSGDALEGGPIWTPRREPASISLSRSVADGRARPAWDERRPRRDRLSSDLAFLTPRVPVPGRTNAKDAFTDPQKLDYADYGPPSVLHVVQLNTGRSSQFAILTAV